MIPQVHVSVPGQNARTLRLAAGSQTIGAAVDCDFLLMDEAIADMQFEVSIEDDAFGLTLLPGAKATLNGNAMKQGVSYDLKGCVTIMVGDVSFVFEGDTLETAAPTVEALDPDATKGHALTDPTGRNVAEQRKLAMPNAISSGTLVVGLALLGWNLFAAPGQPKWQSVAAVSEQPMSADAAASTPKLGKFISDLPRAATGSVVPIDTKREEANSETEAETVFRAAAMVLAGIDDRAKAINVKDGVLKVSGIRSDDPKAKDIRLAILADIPKLKDVKLQMSPEEQITSLRKQVAGIWAGKRPYVVRIDGEVIKPSQELYDGIILTAVSEATIEVDIDATSHTVNLQ